MKYIFTLLFLTLLAGFSSCSEQEENSTKVTSYDEYVVTVASKQLPAIGFSCGNSYTIDAFAIRQSSDSTWRALPYTIDGFDFQEGFESVILLGKTSYYNPLKGEPAWSEYKLVKLIETSQKNSEGLPKDFLSAK